MLKLKECKKLNWFEHYEILEHLENKQINKILEKIKGNTIQLVNNKNNRLYCIIHKSTKKNNIYQISYFDSIGAYADEEIKDIKEGIKRLYKSYSVTEAI